MTCNCISPLEILLSPCSGIESSMRLTYRWCNHNRKEGGGVGLEEKECLHVSSKGCDLLCSVAGKSYNERL